MKQNLKKAIKYLFYAVIVILFLGCSSKKAMLSKYEKVLIQEFPERIVLHYSKFETIPFQNTKNFVFYYDAGDEIDLPIEANGEVLRIDQTIKFKVVKRLFFIGPVVEKEACKNSSLLKLKSNTEWINRIRNCSPHISVDQKHWIPIGTRTALKRTLGESFKFHAEFTEKKGLSMSFLIKNTKQTEKSKSQQ